MLPARQRAQRLVSEVCDLHVRHCVAHQLPVAVGRSPEQTEFGEATHSYDFDRTDWHDESSSVRLAEIRNLLGTRSGLTTQHCERAGHRRYESEDRFQQRRLTRTIGANERQRFAWLQRERNAFHDRLSAVADGESAGDQWNRHAAPTVRAEEGFRVDCATLRTTSWAMSTTKNAQTVTNTTVAPAEVS